MVGFYWVSGIGNSAADYEIGLWSGGHWYLTGSADPFTDREIKVVCRVLPPT